LSGFIANDLSGFGFFLLHKMRVTAAVVCVGMSWELPQIALAVNLLNSPGTD